MDKSGRSLPGCVDWPEETERWFSEWQGSPLTDGWTDQQWSYLYDTALVHAEVWGDMNTSLIGELHRREAYMGVNFDRPQQQEQRKTGGFSVLELALKDRQKRASAAG